MTEPKDILATLSYVKRFSGQTVLIKLGGAALQKPGHVESLCEDLSLLRSVGLSIVLVHGGGPMINAELNARGIGWKFIDGQRVTTPEIMEVVEMVLCGVVNRRIVKTLNHAGIPAVGISGTDASTLLCRPAGSMLGQVGVIEQVNTSVIHSIMNSQTKSGLGAIPVIAPVGLGLEGDTMNVNADWAASRIAQSLQVKKILFLTDQDGIMDKEGKLMPELDAGELEALIDSGTVTGGMLAKTRTILDALKNGVGAIHVLNASKPHALIQELFTDNGVGTVCRLRSRPTSSGEAKNGFATL